MLNAKQIIQRRKELWEEHKDIQQDKEYVEAIADYICTPENDSIRQEVINNPEYFVEMCFTIVDKDSKTVPLFANKVQKAFQAELNQAIIDYKAGLRNSIEFIILKGRQQGFTTWITAYQLALSLLNNNFTGFTVTHDGDTSKHIFNDKAKYPYNQLPNKLRPTKKIDSKTELFFDIINSSWRIATAGNKDLGRSKTIKFLHASEVGLWENIADIFAAVAPAITKDAIQIMETTAQGFNEFYDIWADDDNNWIKLFYKWWDTPEYFLDFETPEHEIAFKNKIIKGSDDFSIKMKNIKIQEKLNWKQLYWYDFQRKKLKAKLPQEFPCSAQEAFLHTGRKYFDVEKLNNMQILAESISILETRKDLVTIYNKPEQGEAYVLGADVAEGLETGDYSHAKILKLSTMEEVAFIHGHMAPDVFGDIIVDIAKEYNDAFVAIERNNHGHSVLATVYRYRSYKNIYYETAVDNKKDPESKKLGWSTNTKTKHLMLDELDTAIRNEEIVIKDKDCIKELYAVVKDEKGNVDLNGKDRVVALSIALQMRKYAKNRNVSFEVF